MPRITRTIGHIEQFKAVCYDLRQMVDCAVRLMAGQPDVILRNALIESFAIHCRALCHFFFAGHHGFPNLRNDDWGAEDYIQNWTPPKPSPDLIEAKEKANKHVAHITDERRNLNLIPSNTYSWKVEAVTDDLPRS